MTNRADDDEKLRLFAPLFTTQELALTAIRHFCVVDWLSSRTGFNPFFSVAGAQIRAAVSDSSAETILSIESINELIEKKHFIILVKNFPVRKDASAVTHCFALPAIVVFTLQKKREETLFTTYSSPENAVGYAISRFPNLSLIAEDKRDAFVYSRLYMHFNLVSTTSIDCSREGVIGGGSLLGNWFLELMRGNSCFALASHWEWDGVHGCFYPNNTICMTTSRLPDSKPSHNKDTDNPLKKEIAAVPANTLNSCLCAPVEPVGLTLLQTQISEHTPISVTIASLILSYLGSWSLPLGYVAHGRCERLSSA